MTHTVSRKLHLTFHSHKPPLHLTHTSHPSAVADWLLVVSEKLDRSWTIVGFMCCCRLTHHMLCSPLGALAVSWSSAPAWTGVRENFSSYLEEVRTHPEGESSGGEAMSSITSLQQDWRLWRSHCKACSMQYLAGALWKAGHTAANTKMLHKDVLSGVKYWNCLSAHVFHTFSVLTVVAQGWEIQPKDNFSRSFHKKTQTLLAPAVGAAEITHKNIL